MGFYFLSTSKSIDEGMESLERKGKKKAKKLTKGNHGRKIEELNVIF